ncbi:EAL domain-containing protein [Clostridium sp. AM58-1XD]|uniref:bifunctional diguanylate cyclase/phosphodiesterase n=1 Tax=Clostridium sp. AM58-1XD TaxID=2292307 RepID=UPI000E4FD1C6|nr:EAL domain-containing protein [Clostridium sp. AM58-1XD]RGY98740.1 EAL domain-containing protein [Clostridium sp. AM58-1XD]
MPLDRKGSFDEVFLNDILDQINVNIYITDIETDQIVYMNETMKKDFKLKHPEGEKCWKILVRDGKQRCSLCNIDGLLAGRSENSCTWDETNLITGKIYKNYGRILEQNGKQYFIQYETDITEFSRLSETARIDELTKMLNRRAGRERMTAALDQARSEKIIFTAALCDVNGLKRVNDMYGHSEGDHLLRYLSSVIRRNVEEPDFAFRLSGDEFVIIFMGKDKEEADKNIQWIGRQLKEGREDMSIFYEVSFSCGLAEVYPEDHYTVPEIISKADERMYIQKREYHIRCARERLANAGAPQKYEEPFDYDREHLYEALTDSTDDYIFVGNMKTGVFRYPPAMVAEFGLPGEIVENAAAFWGKLIHPHDEQGFLESNQEIADGHADSHDIEYRAKNVKGEWIWLRCRGRMMRDEKGVPWLFAGMITNQGKNNKVDHMTGLYNKYEFEGLIKQQIADGEQETLGIIILNIDSFKDINDLYNRSFGDEILRLTANKIEALLPPNARLFRLDGDEFGIVVLGGVMEDLSSIFGRVQRSFHNQQKHNGRKYYCTLSAGCVFYPENADNYLDLLKYANYSLEYSKLMGKNRMTVFSTDILRRKERKLELNELLRESIERGFIGFSIYYQPQIDAATGEVYGAEALARWHCGKYGDVSPGEFIPLLEQSGMIVQLGKWIFAQSVFQCSKWCEKKSDFHISINVSYRQLLDTDVLDFIRTTIDESGLDPSHITMELTETYLVQEDVAIRRMVSAMQEMGIQIAMDDFGTGYSSLFSLKKIPVDIVKIDQGFVRNIATDVFNATFISYITELCHEVGKIVCLEGVETIEEYNAVRDSGIELFQGYYFGRPVAADIFEKSFFRDEKMSGES